MSENALDRFPALKLFVLRSLVDAGGGLVIENTDGSQLRERIKQHYAGPVSRH